MAFSSVNLRLYVYSGTDTSYTDADLRYQLSKDLIIGDTKVNFEIAELIRDYIDIKFNDDYVSYAVWVRVDSRMLDDNGVELSYGSPVINTYLATDGYGFFEEGANAELSRNALLTTNTLYLLEGTAAKLPIFAEGVGKVTIDSSDTQITDTGNTDQKIQYVDIPADSNLIRVYDTDDTTLLRTIKINNICEPKFTPYKVTFVNKYGAFQDIYFFKKSTETFSVTDESYKRNTLANATATYSINQGQRERYNTNARTNVTLNTGFVNEDFNSAIEELFLSENVFIRWNNQTLPIIPKSKDLTFQTSVNDRLSNYAIDFEFAFNKINNVR
ncbi:MAG: hypothetical protein CMJ25_04475 [Phycisphaerae bacterium]|nr:hypothetical protein [Phycisphaerae bacterium]|tara:strand:- start:5741 stop:6727 length:987 start_codon:yes stop_codon:yes gene_type:complete